MARHLDEMQSYIRIAGSNDHLVQPEEILVESIQEPENDNYTNLMESLNDIVFKLTSYRELHENQNYALGIEEGLSLAAEMIKRLIAKQDQEKDE